MPLSRIGAPVVVVSTPSKSSSSVIDTTVSDAAPSSSIDMLPGRRVIICACVSSGKNGRSAWRTSPSLSYSRNFTHSGLSSVCCSAGMASSFARGDVQVGVAGLGAGRVPGVLGHLGGVGQRLRGDRVERVAVG